MSLRLLGGLGALTVAALVVGSIGGLSWLGSNLGAVAVLGIALGVVLAVVAAGTAARPVAGNPYW